MGPRWVGASLLAGVLSGCSGGGGPEPDPEGERSVTMTLTLAEIVEPGVETPVLVRAGVVLADETIDWSETIDIELDITNGTSSRSFGVVDSDGFFESDATLTPGFDLLVVFATATTPDGLAATATAQALAVPTDTDIRLLSRTSGMFADAYANGGGSGQTDSDSALTQDFDAWEESITATISDSDVVGGASATSTVSEDDLIIVDADGASFAGGSVSGACHAEAATTVVPPLDPTQVLGDAGAGTGIDLTFVVEGTATYELALDGTFTGTAGASGLPSGAWSVTDTGGCDVVCEGATFNPNQDGASLDVSERVLLPPGEYRMSLSFDCSAASTGDVASSETDSTMGFDFAFSLPE